MKLPLTTPYRRSCLLLLLLTSLTNAKTLLPHRSRWKTDKGTFLSVTSPVYSARLLPCLPRRCFLISLSLPSLSFRHSSITLNPRNEYLISATEWFYSVRSTSCSPRRGIAAKTQSLRRTKSKRTRDQVNLGTRWKNRERRCKSV